MTGAGRGIGAATAQALVARGMRVIAADVDEVALHRTAADIDATAVVVDVRDHGHADVLVDRAISQHGRLDLIVANAGIGHAGAFIDMTPQRVDDLLTVNVRAPMLLARAALPSMIERGDGAIVLLTSIAGALLVPRETVYSATKAAIEAFAEPLREEVRGHGVTVTTVLPAVVSTGFFSARGEPYERRFPRPVAADRIADAVVAAVENGRNRTVVPGWFGIPIRIRAMAPGLYRSLARRFG